MAHDKQTVPSTQAKPSSKQSKPPSKQSKPLEASKGELEGEGSYSATHRYDEGVKQSVERGDTERLAEEAKAAVDGPEGAALREAEEAAKRGRTVTKH